MGSPKLGRVGDGLGDRARLAERSLRLVPSASRRRGLAREPPSLDLVLARLRPCRELEATPGVFRRLVEISARQRQLAQTRAEPDRVAKAHPGAGGGIPREPIDALEYLPGKGKVAAGQDDVAQVQLGVRKG